MSSGVDTMPDTPTTTGPAPEPATRVPRSGLILICLVAQREIVTQLRRQEFWGSLLLMVIVTGLAFGAQSLLQPGRTEYQVAVSADGAADSVTAALGRVGVVDGGTVAARTVLDDTVALEQVRSAEVDAAVLADGTVRYLDRLPSDLSVALRAALADVHIRTTLNEVGLGPDEAETVLTTPPLRAVPLDPAAQRATERTVIAAVGIFVAFFLMFTFGQHIAQGVLEEKSSRVVEVLLAKVRAAQLLTGKVAGLGVVVMVQILALITSGFLVAVILDVIAEPADTLRMGLLVLLWFLPGYVLFATFWAVAGALVSRAEDLVNAAGPVSFVMTIGLLCALFPFTGVAPVLSETLSMVPGLSWSMMPIRMATETVPWWQVLTALALTAGTVAVLLRWAGRIYVGGLLNNGGVLKARAALRSAKESGLA